MISALFLSLTLIAAANELWSSTPAAYGDLIRQAYPIGNGMLGAMAFGEPGGEYVNLNVDSLWSGGPFENSSYIGGNPASDRSHFLPGIRDWIFQNGTGNVTELMGNYVNYGSFRVLGNLSVVLDGVDSTSVTSYKRSLSLDDGIHRTRYVADGQHYETSLFCSYLAAACMYSLVSNTSLPDVKVKIDNTLAASNLQNSTCGVGFARLSGVTQIGPPEGMRFDGIVRLASKSKHIVTDCDSSTGVLSVSPKGAKALNFIIAADTNYDQKKGNAENDFSFRGADPGPKVEKTISQALTKPIHELRSEHIADYKALANAFSLDLPDEGNSASLETEQVISTYDITKGDPYLESLLFDYSRHLLISSSRPGTLPSNLLGKWSETLEGPWSCDYHLDINLQMNYWAADQTGLGDTQVSLWDYMQDVWVSRGEQTAKLLYDAPDGAWVIHSETNIFGDTAMMNYPEGSDYPVSAAWMMQHVFDHYEYSQDHAWLASQGYPLLKGVATFWLSQLQRDAYFKDGTLVVNPCNSPEHGPATFGCTHYQQLIHQLLWYVERAGSAGIETDTAFLDQAATALENLDTGLHIGSFGEIKEWKLPDSLGYDVPNATHRHLSQLVGWYPGTSLSGLAGGYTNTTISAAVATSLRNRGPGDGADANAGWEKVWRAAAWARLNDTENADYELRFAVSENFAGNGLSMYAGHDPPFQIDANFGIAGAMLAMLVVDLGDATPAWESTRSGDQTPIQTVVLGPAIPSRWAGGSVRGLRLRSGGSVDFEWDDNGLVTSSTVKGRTKSLKVVNKHGDVLASVG